MASRLQKSRVSKIDEKFMHVYKHAVRVACNVNVDPMMLRVAGCQIHRCNAPGDNEMWPFRLLSKSKLNWMSNLPVVIFGLNLY